MALRLRQGLAADRTSVTPASGELIYTTDTKLVYVGDGSTAGGNLISGGGGGGGGGTTYSISSETATGGVNLRLTGSDASQDNVKFAAGSNVTITRTDASTITISSTGGGGGGTSFLVSGDDSVTRTINSGDTFSILGNGNTSVYFDEYNNLTIDTPSQIINGSSGQLAFYSANGSSLQGSAGITFDTVTGHLTVGQVVTNAILSDATTFAIFPLGATDFVSLGGVLDGTQHSGKLLSFDFGPFDPVNPFCGIFSQIHNDANINALQFQRARGTFTSQTSVQPGDFIGNMFFVAFDGTGYNRSASITSFVPAAVSTGNVPGALAFETMNESGVETVATIIDQQQYTNFSGAYRYAVFSVTTGSGNATLTRAQVRGNLLQTTPSGSTRTLTLPAADQFTAGLEILIMNMSVTQSLSVTYTGNGGGPIATIIAANFRKVVCDGNVWFGL